MPINLDISFDREQERQLQRAIAHIEGGIPKAREQAIKRATRKIRSRIVSRIAKHLFKVRNKDLFDTSSPRNRRRPIRRFFTRRNKRIVGSQITIGGEGVESGLFATRTNSQAARAGRIPLSRFGARQISKGVSYKITAGGGRQRIEGAFLATMDTGHEGVFIRPFGRDGGGERWPTGKRRALPPTIGRQYRLPIAELFGPSIPQVAQTHEGVQRVINQEAGGEYINELSSQVDRLLERSVRRG